MRRRSRLLIVFCVFVITPVIVLAGIAISQNLIDNKPDGEQSMSDEERTAGENALRSKPSYEAATAQLNTILVDASSELTQAFPYLRFEWRREATFNTCPDHPDPAIIGVSASRFAGQPIAAADWPRALQIVVDHVAPLGPVESHAFHDETDVHDTVITAGGFSIRFGSVEATALRGSTPCLLPQSALDRTE